ncbi:MAG: PaaI family thioesterase [Bryobacteraceae bacterium]
MRTLEELNAWGRGYLPGLIGFQVTLAEPGHLVADLAIRQELLAPNGYLHAATVVALADSACGYGTMLDLPDTCRSFTTIELKSNFLGTCLEGIVRCDASRVHSGKSTQVWDAVITDAGTGKKIALFRCTQMLLK